MISHDINIRQSFLITGCAVNPNDASTDDLIINEDTFILIVKKDKANGFMCHSSFDRME